MHRAASILALLALAACAKAPSSIRPADVSGAGYQRMSCTELSAEHQRVTLALAPLEKQQKDAAAGDAFGVFILGLPVSSLAGKDAEADIARLKGEQVAINRAQSARQCS